MEYSIYSWGDHSISGYLTDITSENIEDLNNVIRDFSYPILNEYTLIYDSGISAFKGSSINLGLIKQGTIPLAGYSTSYLGYYLRMNNGEFTVNEQGADLDFRVEGDTDANLLFTDASTDRVGIGTSSPSEKLDVNGSIKTRAGGVGHEDNGCYIAYPGGGTYRTAVSTETGYLKITLPVSWTNTMISFDIDIYEYITQKIKKFRVGGYTYSVSTQWINESAMMDSDNDFAKYKVHFGHDGTNCAVYISRISSLNADLGAATDWKYPQISISNLFAGYGSHTMTNWADGWAVGFTTTLGTTTGSIEVSRPYRQHDTSYVFNEYGGNVDFRVEGDTDQYLLFTDASADKVAIGTSSMNGKLNITDSSTINRVNI